MITTPNMLAFAPLHNSDGKKDATGAFQPEALAFLNQTGAQGCRDIDNHQTKQKMRDSVLGAIHFQRPAVVGFFCHGWTTGIQFGFGLQHCDTLAAELARGGTSVRVALYCCSTGGGAGVGGDSGFADCLRDALCRAGALHCQVDAHTTSGHATRNPYVRRFAGMGSPVGGAGGYWIVAPGSSLWKPWTAALKGDLRLRYPLMDVAEIHAELEAGK